MVAMVVDGVLAVAVLPLLAGEKGVPVEEVGALAAEKTISQKLKPGMYYMNSSGQWVQK